MKSEELKMSYIIKATSKYDVYCNKLRDIYIYKGYHISYIYIKEV